jgi:CHRD domain
MLAAVRMRGTAVAAAGLVVAGSLVVSGCGTSAPQTTTSHARGLLRAKLSVGRVVPKPRGASSKARGSFRVGVSADRITWRLTFRHLTGKAIRAEIHYRRKGHRVAHPISLCVPCRSGITGVILNPPQKLRAALLHGRAYVDVRTKRNPRGEIRGPIAKVS